MANTYESFGIVAGAGSAVALIPALARDYKEQHGELDPTGNVTENLYAVGFALLLVSALLFAAGRYARRTS